MSSICIVAGKLECSSNFALLNERKHKNPSIAVGLCHDLLSFFFPGQFMTKSFISNFLFTL